MAKTNLPSVTSEDTFQTWINKTNLLLGELGSSILTASSTGDVTIGNATLQGTFTSTNLSVSGTTRTQNIAAPVGSEDPINVSTQVSFSTANQISSIFKNALGSRSQYANDNRVWEIGLRGSTATGSGSNFIISIPDSVPPLFTFDIDGEFAATTVTADTLNGEATSVLNGVYTVGDQTIGGTKTFMSPILLGAQSTNVTHAVRADRSIDSGTGITGGGNLTENRTLSLDGQALRLHNLNTNGLIVRDGTNIETVSIAGGTGVSVSNGNGRNGNPTISIGQDVSTTSDVEFNDVTSNGRITGVGAVPTGAVMMFASPTPPPGWLECNGTKVTTEYPELRAFLQSAGYPYGRTGTNNLAPLLPDLRGEFVRGWDHGRGVDNGRAFGSSQDDELKSHTHQSGWYGPRGANGLTEVFATSDPNYSSVETGATGGDETRPRNVALLYCIKT